MKELSERRSICHWIAALRRSKIPCVSCEAQDQGALLIQVDLARLPCAGRSTVKRDIAHLCLQGIDASMRGQMKQSGRGASRKTCIVRDWLAGYTFSEIKRRRWHTLGSIERYCGGSSE
jgi:hypothetical protein